MFDLMNRLARINLLPPAANNNISTTPLVSNVFDVRDLVKGSAVCLITTGALTDADAVYSVLVDEGDTGTAGSSTLSDAAAVADADLIGTEVLAAFTFANDAAVRAIGYRGTKRYIRVTITPTTTANSGDTPVSIVGLGIAASIPVANP